LLNEHDFLNRRYNIEFLDIFAEFPRINLGVV
jgi:hypothetical protein